MWGPFDPNPGHEPGARRASASLQLRIALLERGGRLSERARQRRNRLILPLLPLPLLPLLSLLLLALLLLLLLGAG